MQKELLENYISQNKSTREIATTVGKSQTAIRYWLAKYSLKTIVAEKLNHTHLKEMPCGKCHILKSLDNFYIRPDQRRMHSYCKQCFANITKEKSKQFKLQCLQYKNQICCQMCGYDKCIGALDFHHIDSESKDFEISQAKNLTKINDVIKKELDKCIVICANCHREHHYRMMLYQLSYIAINI